MSLQFNATNASVTTDYDGQWLTPTVSVLATITVLSNILVCAVVLSQRRMRTPMNCLLVNLAISDIIVALFAVFQIVLRDELRYSKGLRADLLCKLITGGNFTWMGSAASTFTLTVIAIERFRVVSQASNALLTSLCLKIILVSCWVYAITVNLPLFLVVRYKELTRSIHCAEIWSHKSYGQIYTIFCFCIFGVIPLAAMGVFYTLTIRMLWKNRVRATAASDLRIIDQRKKVTRMMIIVSIIYASCRLPNLFMYMLIGYKDRDMYSSLPYLITVLLVCINSTVNPFVYSLHSSRFREGVNRLLFCRRLQGSYGVQQQT
ncbi:neuropeptide FF receptor 2 [Exaiptasia diaphana]|uniref:G-protein coupled receptors family 1 profile domain-containing protein n=1 Tax=Exaiptasia diaphana TaxID=2652724 RepID=A0A913XJH9_EXADI|nr:neuropeptide FF receptor 2 [Exaiptasia diaphana]